MVISSPVKLMSYLLWCKWQGKIQSDIFFCNKCYLTNPDEYSQLNMFILHDKDYMRLWLNFSHDKIIACKSISIYHTIIFWCHIKCNIMPFLSNCFNQQFWWMVSHMPYYKPKRNFLGQYMIAISATVHTYYIHKIIKNDISISEDSI